MQRQRYAYKNNNPTKMLDYLSLEFYFRTTFAQFIFYKPLTDRKINFILENFNMFITFSSLPNKPIQSCI